MDTLALLRAGLFGIPDAVVQIRELADDPHDGRGGRGLAITLADGLSFEILVERGLDIGAVWAAATPVAWRAPLGRPGPGSHPYGWIGRFGGGLLATCGLDNIGPARDGHGLHGSHHDTPAHDVAVIRLPPEGDLGPGVRISGTVDSYELFGRAVRLHREIESRAGQPRLTVTDRITNEGPEPAPVALLYHINFGAPLVLPGTRINIPAAAHELRDTTPEPTDWTTMPDVLDHITEYVWQHTDLVTNQDGRARATVSGGTPDQPMTAEVTWRTSELPRCMEWQFPVRGRWVLGIEPANSPLWGVERQGPHGGAPLVEPGEHLITGVEITISTARTESRRRFADVIHPTNANTTQDHYDEP